MNTIVAVDENWAIGKQGGLLTHLSGDLKYYKEKTVGHHIVLGRKTLESFPGGRPLPDRENIVLTGNRHLRAPHCTVCASMAQLVLYLARLPQDEIFISGGESLYRQMMPLTDIFFVTHLLARFSGADKFFPDLTKQAEIRLVWQSERQKENGLEYYFARYERQTK